MLAGLILLLATVTPGDQYNRGNDAYEAADYVRAVALYDSAAATVTSADILYNRGNARFKLGEVGKAIADYSQARVLAPHDGDIRHNLEFARAYRPDKTLTIQNPIIRTLTGFLRVLDLGLARLLAGILFLFALAGFGLLLVFGNRSWLWVAVTLSAGCLYAFASWMSWTAVVNPDRAVVIVPELVLLSGPGEDYKEIVIVHDGLEGKIRSRRGRYVLLQVPGGTGGWADSTAVERIFGTE